MTQPGPERQRPPKHDPKDPPVQKDRPNQPDPPLPPDHLPGSQYKG